MTRSKHAGRLLTAVLGAAAGYAVFHLGYLLFNNRISTLSAALFDLAILAFSATAILIRIHRLRGLPEIWSDAPEGIAFLAIICFAFWIRLLGWDLFPPSRGQMTEEPQTLALIKTSIATHSVERVFPVANLIGQAGARLSGLSLHHIRLTFLTWSVIGLIFAWIAGRWWFRNAASAAAVLIVFASLEYLIGASRIAMETMSPVPTVFMVLAALGLLKRRPGWDAAVLTGIASGLILLEHFSFKLIAPLTGLAILLLPLPDRRWKAGIGHALVFTLAIAVVLMPYMLQGRSIVTGDLLEGLNRHQKGPGVGELNPVERIAVRSSQIGIVLTFLTQKGEYPEVLPIHRGIVDPLTGVFSLAGLVWCLMTSQREPWRLYFALVFVLHVLLSSVMVANASRYRLLPAVPIMVMMFGFLMDDLLIRFRDNRFRHAVWALPVLAAGIINVHWYFGRDITDPLLQEACRDSNLELAFLMSDLQHEYPGTPIYLMSNKDFLGVANDYDFAYDATAVTVLTDRNAPRPADGLFISHGRFIEWMEDLPAACVCRHLEPPEYQESIRVCLCRESR